MKRHIILWAMLCITTLSALAQKEIKGTVVDNNGEPMIGAAIKVGKSGTISDLNGHFTITPTKGAKQMTVSFIGYETKTIVLDGKSNYKVVLKEDTQSLDDLVVIGYGSVKKGDVTTAISKVDMEEMDDRPVDNVGALLQGELAGVEVTNEGGPGGQVSLNVRGAVTFDDESETQPLIVIDGVIMDEDFDLGTLNPRDIASIEVLKDASAAAIYGSMGANGVVIVSMRRAKKGDRLNISASANFSIDQVIGKMNVMSGSQWANWMDTMQRYRYMDDSRAMKGGSYSDDFIMQSLNSKIGSNAGVGSFSVGSMIDPRWTLAGHPGISYIDWQDAIFRIAPRQNYTLSVSGATDRSNFRVSVGYTNTQGVIRGSSSQRLTINASGEGTIANHITFGGNIAPSMSMRDGNTVTGTEKSTTSLNILGAIPVTEQISGLETGVYPNQNYAWTATRAINPYYYNEGMNSSSENFEMTTSAFLKGVIMKGLSAKVNGSWTMRNQNRRSYRATNTKSPLDVADNDEGYLSTSRFYAYRTNNFRLEATLDFARKFGKHSVTAVAGWSTDYVKYSDTYRMEFEGFPNDAIESMPNASYAREITNLSAIISPSNRTVSYFARGIYNYDDRYIFNASVRRDGSSKFPKNSRWTTFPAFSAAWKISNEQFWPQNDILTSLKYRMSYGQTGRNSIPSAAYTTSLASTYYYEGDTYMAAYKPGTTIGNDNLMWQKVDSWNFAFDVGLFNNRISFAIDYYNAKTSNMLYRMQLPAISGFSYMYTNIGSNRVQGFDLEMKTINLKGGGNSLKWTTNFNAGTSWSEVLSLGDTERNLTGFQQTQIRQVGKTVGEFWLYDDIGIFKDQAELDSYPHISGATVGSPKLRDANGDGQITEDDRIYAGRPTPSLILGMTNSFTWKRWSLSVRMNAQFGGHIYSAASVSTNASSMNYGYDSVEGQRPLVNHLENWANMWYSEENTGDGSTPNVYTTRSNIYLRSTRYLYKSDFIKMSNITLGYQIPVKPNWWLKSASVSLSIENVFRWDRYDAGFSPEGRYVRSGTSSYDAACYPQNRSYSISLRTTF